MASRGCYNEPVRGCLLVVLLVFNQGGLSWARAECDAISGGPIDKTALVGARLPAFDPTRVIATFTAQGFTCSAFNPRTGILCKARAGVVPGYSEEVAVIIPAHFVPGERANIFTHIHGDNKTGIGFDKFLQKYKFEDMLADSGRNSIMIVPFSHSDKTSGNHQDLADSKKYRKFMGAITGSIQKAQLARYSTPAAIAISGHSGAFLPIAQMLEHECADAAEVCYSRLTNELHLLDATYGQYNDRFAKFARRTPAPRFTALTCAAGETVNGAKDLIKRTRDPSDASAPALLEPGTSEETFVTTNPAVMRTKTGHEAIVSAYLPQLLRER